MRAFTKKSNGIISSIELKNRKTQILYWCMFLICLVLALICVLPVIWIMFSSLKDISEFYSSPPTIIPKTFQPEKILISWEQLKLGSYLRNTLIIAAGRIIFCIVGTGLAGYVLSRLKPKGTGGMMRILLWSMMLPGSVSLVAGYLQAVDFPYLHINFTNNFTYFWLGALGNAYYTLLFKSFFDSISESLVEAAKIDGCQELGIFFKIIMPLSIPIVVVIGIFTFNDSWSDFLMPYLLLKDESLKTISQLIFSIKMSGSQVSQDIYLVMVMMSMIPPLIIFLIFNKYIMNGINIGGVKG